MSSNGDIDQCLEEIEDMINDENFMVLDEVNEGEDFEEKAQFSGIEYDEPKSPQSENSDHDAIVIRDEEFDKQSEIRETPDSQEFDKLKEDPHLSESSSLDNEETLKNECNELKSDQNEETNIPAITDHVLNNTNEDENEQKNIPTNETILNEEEPTDNSEPKNTTVNAISNDITFNEVGKPTEDNIRAFLHVVETFEYTREQMTITDIGRPKKLHETPVQIINSKKRLKKLLGVVRHAQEISLDLQMYHKGYEPQICLIALSTREVDYLIDSIQLKESLSLLTEIFLSPKIVKVIYKSAFVLGYLQQLLHLFVVNTFDICEVATFLDGNAGNVYQLLSKIVPYSVTAVHGDYRKRPIDQNMKKYGRTQSHYLIYLYHHYKNKLLKDYKQDYPKILDRCRDLCKVLFTGRRQRAFEIVKNELKLIQQSQDDLLERLDNWRHSTAKKHDVNFESVLSRPQLISLTIQMPTTEEDVLAVANTHFVKREVHSIIEIIEETKQEHTVLLKVQCPKKLPDKKFAKRSEAPEPKFSRRPKKTLKRKLDDKFEPHVKKLNTEQNCKKPEGYRVEDMLIKNAANLLENLSNNTKNALLESVKAVSTAETISRASPFVTPFLNLTPLMANTNLPLQTSNFNPQLNNSNQNPPQGNFPALISNIDNSLPLPNNQMNSFNQASMPQRINNFPSIPPVQNPDFNQNTMRQTTENDFVASSQKPSNPNSSSSRVPFRNSFRQEQNNISPWSQPFNSDGDNFTRTERRDNINRKPQGRSNFSPWREGHNSRENSFNQGQSNGNQRSQPFNSRAEGQRDNRSSGAHFSANRGANQFNNHGFTSGEQNRQNFTSTPGRNDVVGNDRSFSGTSSAKDSEIDQFQVYKHVLSSMNEKINELQRELGKFQPTQASPGNDMYTRRPR